VEAWFDFQSLCPGRVVGQVTSRFFFREFVFCFVVAIDFILIDLFDF